MAAAHVTMGGLGTANPVTEQMKVRIVATLAIMPLSFSLGWAPLAYVVAIELPSLRLRDRVLQVGFFVNVVGKRV